MVATRSPRCARRALARRHSWRSACQQRRCAMAAPPATSSSTRAVPSTSSSARGTHRRGALNAATAPTVPLRRRVHAQCHHCPPTGFGTVSSRYRAPLSFKAEELKFAGVGPRELDLAVPDFGSDASPALGTLFSSVCSPALVLVDIYSVSASLGPPLCSPAL